MNHDLRPKGGRFFPFVSIGWAIFVSLSLTLIPLTVYALEAVDLVERELLKEETERQENLRLLAQAKLYLLSGNLRRAEAVLHRIRARGDAGRLLQSRYLALVYFIKGDYEKSLNILTDRHMQTASIKKKTCSLELANRVILNRLEKVKELLEFCSSINGKYAATDFAWLEFLLGVRQKNASILSGRHLAQLHRFLENNDMVRLWLKMGLYLNQEHLLSQHVKHLGAEAYQSKKIRELMGLLYYRLGDKEQALKFIDDLSTANSENIQGNLKLEKNQYELAFGHFQLALKKKQNSVNAIERSLTLAWLLGKFSEGLEIVRKVRAHEGSINKKHALLAAFLTRNGQPEAALAELAPLVQSYQGKQPREANELLSYNSLLAEKNEDAKKYADLLCRQREGMACWVLFHLGLWEDLGKTVKRDELIFVDNEINVENLKKKAPAEPLEEEIFVDQRDIEELDEAQVQEGLH